MRNKLISIFLLAFLLAALPLNAAAQQLDHDRNGSVSVTLVSPDGAQPMAGAELSVYHVATVGTNTDGDLSYVISDVFADGGISLEDANLVSALDAFVAGNELAARKIVTDSQGRATCADLPLGLYFVKQTGAAEGFAPCASFLVTLPVQTENGFQYDVDASPKTDVARLVSITVKKVWNMDKSATMPASVTVHLLRNDEIMATATLNAQNNWQVTYEDMPESDAYRIKEVNVPKGFTATYTRKGYEFTVTNTSSLAQTGQLIWPIPVLATAGILFLLMGFVLLRKAENRHA